MIVRVARAKISLTKLNPPPGPVMPLKRKHRFLPSERKQQFLPLLKRKNPLLKPPLKQQKNLSSKQARLPLKQKEMRNEQIIFPSA